MYNIEQLTKNRPLFIWGTGNAGKEVLDAVEKMGLKINGFIDNDCTKWNNFNIKGYSVFPPNFLLEYQVDKKPYVLIGSMYINEISECLRNMGYNKKIDYYCKKLEAFKEYNTILNIHAFVQEFLNNRRQNITTTSFTQQPTSKIWVYWAQGKKNMPPIVQACLNQLYLVHDKQDIVFLSDDNISDFVTLPDYVYEKIFFNKTHFSDVLRVTLLAEYGGAWIDATCYCRGSINPLLEEARKSGFFAYSRNDRDLHMISSWFFASRPNEIIPTLLRDALYFYWETREKQEHYFILHFIFEALYNLDNEFRSSWDSTFRLNAYDPHILQGKLFEEFNLEEWNRIMGLSLVHKLTYKYTVKKVPFKTYLKHVLTSTSVTESCGETD